MTIASCPRCEEQVRVPVGAAADATVQCPLCREEYSLAEPLRRLPPELVVVDNLDAPPAVDDESSWEALEAPEEAQLENDLTLAPVVEAKPAFDALPGGAGRVTSVRPSARRAKPKGSPIKSVLSIIIGGMMAFPIAQLILWYLPGDLKRDFGAGPVVAKYLPAVVPAKFRGTPAGGNDGEATDLPDFDAGGSGAFSFGQDEQQAPTDRKKRRTNRQRSPDTTQPSADASGGSGFELPDTEGSFAAAAADILDSAMDSGAPEEDVPAADDVPGVDVPEVSVPQIDVPGVELPGVEVPAVDLPSLSPDPTAVATEESPHEPAGSPSATNATSPGKVKGARVYEHAEVVDAVSKAAAASDAWDAAGDAATGTQKSTFYRAMSSLGEVLALSDRQGEEAAEQRAETSRLLATVAESSAKVDAIRAIESRWIGLPRRSRESDGICICATVESVDPRGELFETVVESQGWSVPIITRDDPSSTIDVGDQVLVLGAIVSEPADNLAGYDGDAEVVILGGIRLATGQQ